MSRACAGAHSILMQHSMCTPDASRAVCLQAGLKRVTGADAAIGAVIAGFFVGAYCGAVLSAARRACTAAGKHATPRRATPCRCLPRSCSRVAA
ncbi:hypothetical protein EON67_09675 [archaeon]|nr:MAG: hypothetical protein EON67_09675 [archaeon]